MSTTRPTDLIIAPRPFTPALERRVMPAGYTVAAGLAEAVQAGALTMRDVPAVRVYVNGEPLPRDVAMTYRPAPGETLNVVVEPQGGNTGRTLFQLFYTIGAAVVSFYFGPIYGTAVLLAGTALSSVIWRPQRPEAQPDANNTGALTDQSNTIRRRDMMPLVLGEQRVPFDVAALPYTQLEGEDVWLHVIFGVHYGPVRVENIKIGETALADYPAADIQLEYKLTPGPRVFDSYPGRVFQENFQDELDQLVAEVHTTADGAEFIELDITCPSGLQYVNEKGKSLPQAIHLYVEFKPAGGGAYGPAPVPPAFSNTGANLGPGAVFILENTRDTLRRRVRFATPVAGKYDVRVTLQPRYRGDGDEVDTVYWTALRTMARGAPIVDEQLACIALRIKSSEDLNGNLPVVTGVATPICPVWDGASWGNPVPTSNPAALAHWLLTGPAAARPMTPEEIDPSVGAHFNLARDRNWVGAYHLQQEASLGDALRALGVMGRFSLYWNGEAMCLVSDWVRAAPRQLFTARNVEGYSYERAFPEPLHALFVEFQNTERDSQGDELWVYDDGYDAATATEVETYRIPFACTAARAYREGRVWIAKRKLGVERHQWTSGIDTIVSSYGDRVLVSHPTALFGLGEARVRFRHMAGALVAGVRLDSPVVIEAGKTYAIDVRRPDGVLNLPVAGAPGNTRDLYFAAPLAAADAPRKGDLIAFGLSGLVTEDLEILDIDPGEGMTASITAGRYLGPEIEAAETGAIPPLQTRLTNRMPAPAPRIIGTPTGSPSGATAAFEVEGTRTDGISGFAVRWRITPDQPAQRGAWQVLPPLPASARQASTPAIPEAVSEPGDITAQIRVDIEVRTIMLSGDQSAAARATGIVIRRGVPGVAAFYAVGAKRTAEDGSAYPVIEVSAANVTAGLVQDLVVEYQPAGAVPNAYTSLGAPLPAINPRGDYRGVQPGASYDVRGRWRTVDGWPGGWAYQGNVQVPADSSVAGDTVNVGGTPAEEVRDAAAQVPQLRTDVDLVGGDLETLDDQVNAAETGIAARLATLDDDIRRADTGVIDVLATLDDDIRRADTGIAARLGAIDEQINEDVNGLADRLAAVDDQINEAETGLAARLVAADLDIQGIDQQLNTAETGIRDRLAALAAAFGTIPEDGEPVLTRIADLETEQDGAAVRLSLVEATSGRLAGMTRAHPVATWDFLASDEGWATAHGSGGFNSWAQYPAEGGFVHIIGTGDVSFNSPVLTDEDRINGALFPIVVIDVENRGGAPLEELTLYYATTGHGFSIAYSAQPLNPRPVAPLERRSLVYDLRAAGQDWTGPNPVTRLRFDPTAQASMSVRVYRVQVVGPDGAADARALGARVFTAEEALVDLAEDKAEASRVTLIEAQIGYADGEAPETSVAARILEVEEVITVPGQAVGTRLEQLIASVGTQLPGDTSPTATLYARDFARRQAIATLEGGKASVSRVEGVEATLSRAAGMARVHPYAAWEFLTGDEGWSAGVAPGGFSNYAGYVGDGGFLHVVGNGDLFAISPVLTFTPASEGVAEVDRRVDGRAYPVVFVDVANVSGVAMDELALYFTTTARGQFSASQRGVATNSTPIAPGERRTLVYDMRDDLLDWVGGTITQVRFDGGNGAGQSFRLYSIRAAGPRPGEDIKELRARAYTLEAAVIDLEANTASAERLQVLEAQLGVDPDEDAPNPPAHARIATLEDVTSTPDGAVGSRISQLVASVGTQAAGDTSPPASLYARDFERRLAIVSLGANKAEASRVSSLEAAVNRSAGLARVHPDAAWDFLASAEGWTVVHGSGGFVGSAWYAHDGGHIHMIGSGDVHAFSPILGAGPPDHRIVGADFPVLLIDVLNSGGADLEEIAVRYATVARGGFTNSPALLAVNGSPIKPGERRTLVFDGRAAGQDWASSVITRLRFDPTDQADMSVVLYRVQAVGPNAGADAANLRARVISAENAIIDLETGRVTAQDLEGVESRIDIVDQQLGITGGVGPSPSAIARVTTLETATTIPGQAVGSRVSNIDARVGTQAAGDTSPAASLYARDFERRLAIAALGTNKAEASRVSSLEAQITRATGMGRVHPFASWNFELNGEGFAANTPGPPSFSNYAWYGDRGGYVHVVGNGDVQLYSPELPEAQRINGREYPLCLIEVENISSVAMSELVLYYRTSTRGYDGAYGLLPVAGSAPVTVGPGEQKTLVFDGRHPGQDWASSFIVELRFDGAGNDGQSYKVHRVQVIGPDAGADVLLLGSRVTTVEQAMADLDDDYASALRMSVIEAQLGVIPGEAGPSPTALSRIVELEEVVTTPGQAFGTAISSLTAAVGNPLVGDPAAGQTLFARDFTRRTDIASLNTNKADASRVSVLEARSGALYGMTRAHPSCTWDFSANITGWSVAIGAISWIELEGAMRVQGSGDIHIISPLPAAPHYFSGRDYPLVLVEVENDSPGTPLDDLVCYYATTGHGATGAYFARPALGDFTILPGQRRTLLYDMSQLTAGGLDWVNSFITYLRLDFANSANQYFKVHRVQVLGPNGARDVLDLAARVTQTETATTDLATGKADARVVRSLEAASGMVRAHPYATFDFETGAQGWFAVAYPPHTSNYAWYDGSAYGGIGGHLHVVGSGDVVMFSDVLPAVGDDGQDHRIIGRDYPLVMITVRNDSTTTLDELRLYFSTTVEGFSEPQSAFPISGAGADNPVLNGETRTLVYDMRKLAYGGNYWLERTIQQLRLDFSGGQGQSFRVLKIQALGPDGGAGQRITGARIADLEEVVTTPGQALGSRFESIVSAVGAKNEADLESGSLYARAYSLRQAVTTLNANKAEASRVTGLEVRAARAEGNVPLALNVNATFGDWKDGLAVGVNIPTGWSDWGSGWNNNRFNGFNSPYCYRQDVTNAAGHYGIAQFSGGALDYLKPGWYVLEADIFLEGGTSRGAGLYTHSLSAADIYQSGHFMSFWDTRDSSDGPSDLERSALPQPLPPVTGRRRFAKLIQLTGADMTRAQLYLASNWSVMPGGGAVKSIQWHAAFMRPATQGEIQAQKADANATTALARVQTVENVLTTPGNAVGDRFTDIVAAVGGPVPGDPNTGTIRARLRQLDQATATLATGTATATRLTNIEALSRPLQGMGRTHHAVNYDFSNEPAGFQGWTFERQAGVAMVTGGMQVIASGGGDVRMHCPVLPEASRIVGRDFPIIIAEVTNTGTTPLEELILFYSTTTHGISGAFYGRPKQADDYPVAPGERRVIVWDMRPWQAQGFDDWATSTITQLHIDLTNAGGANFVVHRVAALGPNGGADIFDARARLGTVEGVVTTPGQAVGSRFTDLVTQVGTKQPGDLYSGSLWARTFSADNAVAALQTGKASASRVDGIEARYDRPSVNDNPSFALFNVPANYNTAVHTHVFPEYWGGWSLPQATRRVAGDRSPWAVQQYTDGVNEGGIVVAGGTALAAVPAGHYVIEADIDAELLGVQGAGVYLYGFGNGGTPVSAGINFATEKDTAGYLGNANPSTKRSWRKLVHLPFPGGKSAVTMHAMTDWTGFSATRTAKAMRWDRVSLRPASDAEVQANKHEQDLVAGVYARSDATVTKERLEGRYVLQAVAGDVISGLRLLASSGPDGTVSLVSFLASAFEIRDPANPTQGGAPFSFSGGVLNLARALRIGGGALLLDAPTKTIQINLGDRRLVLGGPFGASSDLLFWVGANMGAEAMTAANGQVCIGTDGQLRFRGATTGQRVEIDFNGMRIYHANGNLLMRLGAW